MARVSVQLVSSVVYKQFRINKTPLKDVIIWPFLKWKFYFLSIHQWQGFNSINITLKINCSCSVFKQSLNICQQ